MTRARPLGWLLAVAALAFLGWFLACKVNARRMRAADDAFITYVYGRNLAEGHGLRYNATDAEPTTGTSSLLHVLFAALAYSLDVDPLLATRMLGILSLVGLAVIFGLGASLATRAPPTVGLVAGAAVVFGLSFLSETEVHLGSGMDTLLFFACHGLVAAWAYWRVLDPRPLGVARGVASAGLLFMLVLARPEGLFLAFCYLAVVAAANSDGAPERTFGGEVKRLAPAIVPFVALVVIWAAWRVSYFGGFLSNPYYVKSANRIFGSTGAFLPGAEITVRFILLRCLPLAVLVGLLVRTLELERAVVRKAVWLFVPSTLTLLLYSRAIHEMAGGFRYEYPMLVPLLGVLVLYLCRLYVRSPGRFRGVLVGGAVCAPLLGANVMPQPWIWAQHPRSAALTWVLQETEPDNALARLGADLAETGLGQEATILLSGAGQVPWLSRFRAIDWIGLNNTTLSGREAMTIDEVWAYIDSEDPDVVYSILPPATPGARSREDDPNFQSGNVQRTLAGRGSELFVHWERARLEEMFWREMVYVRDRCEFGACYKLGDAWGDEWWLFAYVRKDSPHHRALLGTFAESGRTDRESDLSEVFPVDPRTLGGATRGAE